MQVKKADIAPLLAATFPNYTGRKFTVKAAASVTLYDLNWSGGTRNQYHAATTAGKPIGNGQAFNAAAPWKNNAEGETITIPPGAIVAEHSIFCGKDCGITFYINPADMPRLLPMIADTSV